MQSQLFSPRAEDEIFFISMPIAARTAANWRGRKESDATNILLSPDFQRLRGELMRVLARYPDAQAEVAAVFREAGLRAAAEMSVAAPKRIAALPAEAEHAA